MKVDMDTRPDVYKLLGGNNSYQSLYVSQSIVRDLEMVANTDNLQDENLGWLGEHVLMKIKIFIEAANIGEDKGLSLFGRLFSRIR